MTKDVAVSVKELSSSLLRLDPVYIYLVPFSRSLSLPPVLLLVKLRLSTLSRVMQSRIRMELNYMMAYGSAEASLRLLWRFGLMEILLPIQVW